MGAGNAEVKRFQAADVCLVPPSHPSHVQSKTDLQALFQVQLAKGSDDVLPILLDADLDGRIRLIELGEPSFESLKVSLTDHLHGHPDDGLRLRKVCKNCRFVKVEYTWIHQQRDLQEYGHV